MVQKGKWTIAVGCDSNGLEYKNHIKSDIEADPRVAKVIDLGILSKTDTTAYPHVAVDVATTVKEVKPTEGF